MRKELLTSVFIFVLTFSAALGQTTFSEKIAWIQTLGAWWLFFFIIGIAFIFAGIIFGRVYFKLRKWLSLIGLIFIFLGTFGAEMVYVLPMLGGKTINYATECTSLTYSGNNLPENVVGTFSCIFSGYAPANFEWGTIVTFVIFGIIAPLGILIALFYEFTDFLTNSGVRNVVTFLSALIAFRVLLATLFIELLSYGFAGLGILLVDYFFFMVIFRAMRKLWIESATIQNILTYTKAEHIADLTAQLRRINEVLATLPKDDPNYEVYLKRKEDIEKELNELKSKK